jgi:hypothetical protein
MKTDSLDVQGTLHAQRVATLPAWSAADEGRVIYALNVHKFYVGSNTAWVELGASTPYVLPDPLSVTTLNTHDLSVSGSISSSASSSESAVFRNLKAATFSGYDSISLNEQLFEITSGWAYSLIKSCVVTPATLKTIYWPGATTTGTTVKDIVSGHDATLTGRTLDYGVGGSSNGLLKSINFTTGNGTQYFTSPHHSDFTFSTGAADVDFTIGMVSWNGFSCISKFVSTGFMLYDMEWSFGYSGGSADADYGSLRVFDNNSKGYKVIDSAPISTRSILNVLIGKMQSGTLSLYHNGSLLSTTLTSSGYTRMRSTTANIVSNGGYAGFYSSKPIGCVFIINGEALSATAIRTISDFMLSLGKTY